MEIPAQQAAQPEGKNQQQKSKRLRVWSMLEKGHKDRHIIMRLDIDPEEYRKYKGEWLLSGAREQLAAALALEKDDEIHALIQLYKVMQDQKMKPSEYVNAIKDSKNLSQHVAELRLKISTLKEKLERAENCKADLEETNDWLEEKRRALEPTVAKLELKAKNYEIRVNRLGAVIAGMKDEPAYREFRECVESEKGGELFSSNFVKTTVGTVLRFSSSPGKLALIKQLEVMEKNNDEAGARKIIHKIREDWMENYYLLRNAGNEDALKWYRFLKNLANSQEKPQLQRNVAH